MWRHSMQADSKFINTLMLDFSGSQTEWRAQPSCLMKTVRAATHHLWSLLQEIPASFTNCVPWELKDISPSLFPLIMGHVQILPINQIYLMLISTKTVFPRSVVNSVRHLMCARFFVCLFKFWDNDFIGLKLALELRITSNYCLHLLDSGLIGTSHHT